MKYFELDQNEQRVLKDFETGRLRRVRNMKRESLRYRQFARATLNKTRNINIRVSDRDLQKIRALAVARGLPYQTLISALLHQYSTNKSSSLDRELA